jgi:hypothetical protein
MVFAPFTGLIRGRCLLRDTMTQAQVRSIAFSPEFAGTEETSIAQNVERISFMLSLAQHPARFPLIYYYERKANSPPFADDRIATR